MKDKDTTGKSSKHVAVHMLIWLIIVTLAYLPFRFGSGADQDVYPRKPIDIIVPFKAGGGSDVLVRMFQKTINKNKLLPVPMIVINRPGASATDGSRFVKDAEPDGYTILNLHEAIIISKYLGSVNYGPEAFEPIAGTVITGTVIVVKEDSLYKSLEELLAGAKQNPGKLIFGCALGTPTHVNGLIIEREADIKFNLIQSGGGAARLEQLMGNHIDVSVFSVNEFASFKSQGLKALAYMGEQRHPDLKDIPTAKECGVNAENDVMQYWWFPKGTDPKKIEIIAGAFKEALEDEELLAFIKKNNATPDFLIGDELSARIKRVEDKVSIIEAREVQELPQFHLIVLGTLGLFLAFILWDTHKQSQVRGKVTKEPVNYTPAVVTIATLALYIYLISSGYIDFRILTFIFMMGLGLFLNGKKPMNKTVLLECALIISLGTYYVFTNIVHVDLP
jgi:putative tricarboxylic transport membrane protein